MFSSLFAHGIVFLAGSAFLALLNILTSPEHPWAYYPIAGWGIGMAHHVQNVWNKWKRLKALRNNPNITEEQYDFLMELLRVKGNMAHHRTAFFAVNLYLAGINLITDRSFMWFLIPMGAWMVGFLAHCAVNLPARAFLKNKLRELGFIKGRGKIHISVSSNAGAVFTAKSEQLKNELLSEIAASPELKNHFGELEPFLNKFCSQVKELEKKESELSLLLSSVSADEISSELAVLREKHKTAQKALVKKEYEKSIQQYERHHKALQDLEEQREVCELRLSSSIALLEQFKLDAARIKTRAAADDITSLAMLREKSKELDESIEDFESSLAELE